VRANRRGIDSMVGVQTISQTNSKKLVEYRSYVQRQRCKNLQQHQ
jgi:hypothetical protein